MHEQSPQNAGMGYMAHAGSMVLMELQLQMHKRWDLDDKMALVQLGNLELVGKAVGMEFGTHFNQQNS